MMTEHSKRADRLAGVVILAGGASKRMGYPKAMLTLPTGESLLDYHVRHTSELQVPILIADNGRSFCASLDATLDNRHSPIIHIADYGTAFGASKDAEQIKMGGALVAIESACQSLIGLNDLEAQNDDISWLLVMSCDSLVPAPDLWQKLQASKLSPDKKVVCLKDDHYLYPLLGIYQLSVEPNLKAYIDHGQRRVLPFIKPIAQAVPFIEQWQHLTNFNTPKDFARACTALSDL